MLLGILHRLLSMLHLRFLFPGTMWIRLFFKWLIVIQFYFISSLGFQGDLLTQGPRLMGASYNNMNLNKFPGSPEQEKISWIISHRIPLLSSRNDACYFSSSPID